MRYFLPLHSPIHGRENRRRIILLLSSVLLLSGLLSISSQTALASNSSMPTIDALQAPTAAETDVTLTGGALSITDVNGGTSNDALTLTINGSNLRINDPANMLNGTGTGVVAVDANTVDVPLANITAGLTVDTKDGTDIVNLNAALDLGSGNLVVASDVISVSAPVTATGTAAMNLTATQSITVGVAATLTTDAGAITLEANTAGTSSGDFAAIVVNGGTIQTTDGAITLNGQGGDGAEDNQGVVLYNNAAISSVNGDITITGDGGGDGTDNDHDGVLIVDGSRVESTGTGATAATITINGTGGTGLSRLYGVNVDDAEIVSTVGALKITGTGGAASGDFGAGVRLGSGAVISSTGTAPLAATIAITGTGGNGDDDNQGIRLSGFETTIGTIDGDITLVGTGGGTGVDNHGIRSESAIVSLGTGNIVITGTGSTTGDADGITMVDDALIQSVASGMIAVTGVAGQEWDGVFLTDFAAIVSEDGMITIIGESAEGSGVVLEFLAEIVATGNANIKITGQATGGSSVDGIAIINGALVQSLAAGTIHMQGTANGQFDGIYLTEDAAVEATDGAVTMTGDSSGDDGVDLDGGGAIVALGSGDITITGTTTAIGEDGIVLNDDCACGCDCLIIAATAGNLRLHGTTGANGDDGIDMEGTLGFGPGIVFAAAQRLQTGLSAASEDAVDVAWRRTLPRLQAAGGGGLPLPITTGDITLVSDSMDLTGGLIGGAGNLIVKPATASTTIGLGDNALGDLHLRDTSELSTFFDGFASITIGDVTNGTGTVDIDQINFVDPVTIAGGTINDNTGTDINAVTDAVILDGNVAPGQSPGILNVTGNFVFADNDTFTVEIGGTSPGEAANNHDQLNVTGTVAIGNNVTLSAAAVNGYNPTAGDTIVIINNDDADAISGTFNGLAEGATVTIDGEPYALSYTGGDGNDAVLIAVSKLNNGTDVTQQSVTATYNSIPGNCPTSTIDLPIHTVTPTLANNTANNYTGLYFQVRDLAYNTDQGGAEPTLCNADNGTPGNGGVGARLTIPGTLTSGGTISPALEIGLPARARYRIFLDLYGVPTTILAADVNGMQHLGQFQWEFDANGNLVDSNVQLFLPFVVR